MRRELVTRKPPMTNVKLGHVGDSRPPPSAFAVCINSTTSATAHSLDNRRRDRTESAFEAQAQREQLPVFTRWCVKLNPNRQARRRESGGEHEAGRARATAR